MQYIQCTDLFYKLNTVKLKMIGIGVGNLFGDFGQNFTELKEL